MLLGGRIWNVRLSGGGLGSGTNLGPGGVNFRMVTSKPSEQEAGGSMKAIAIVSATALLSAGAILRAWAGNDDDDTTTKETVLYVWAGDQARTNPDFLAVIDFDEHSPLY